MQIVGVIGRKRHGKNSVGDVLRDEFDFTQIAIADPIKRICMDLYGFTYEQVYGDLKEVVDERWGITPRHALQQLGTEVGRNIHLETWTRYCLQTIREASEWESLPLLGRPEPKLLHVDGIGFRPHTFDGALRSRDKWVITDLRIKNEAELVWQAGGTVVRVVRPSLEGTQNDTHLTETAMDEIEPDLVILNDGTLEDLRAKVRGLFGGSPR